MSTCKTSIYKLAHNRLHRNIQHSQDCGSVCNACAKDAVSVDNRKEIFIPQGLLVVLNEDGYFRFGIKCIKQVNYLFKILFTRVKLNGNKISVGSIVYKLEVNNKGVYVRAPDKTVVARPEENLHKVIKEMLTNFHLSNTSTEDFLLCLNFLIHPRKVTSFFNLISLINYTDLHVYVELYIYLKIHIYVHIYTCLYVVSINN